MEQIKSTDYTYELGQVASILSNPQYTLEKILEYQQESIERIDFEKNHGIDPQHELRGLRIWNACVALLKPKYTL